MIQVQSAIFHEPWSGKLPLTRIGISCSSVSLVSLEEFRCIWELSQESPILSRMACWIDIWETANENPFARVASIVRRDDPGG
jgi:hypothetical protein